MKRRIGTIATMFGVAIALTANNLAWAGEAYVPCLQDAAKQQQRSIELKQLERADQADRPGNQMRPGAEARDRERRQRVGQIFGEGCFKAGADFANAAMVYQHGGDMYGSEQGQTRALAPEHLFQAFLWAKRATELGTDSKWLTASAIDRYLQYSGRKQLFGTQGFKVNVSDRCWCIVPTEAAFPDSIRVQYTGKTLAQALEHVRDFPGQPADCKPAYCPLDLAESPQGTVPGFW